MAYGDGAGGGRGGLGVAQGDATSQGKTEPQPSESIGKLNTSTVALAEPPRAPAYPDWLYTYRTLIAASAASVCSVLAGSPVRYGAEGK